MTQPAIQNINNTPFWRSTKVLLLFILVLAGILRLYNLEQSPPGLNQDEAANAWNAYCLLKTGTDQMDVSWPIFYTRSLGGNSSTLFIYYMIPFQALGGMNIMTTRLPSAVAGIFTVFIVYFVGKRLFNTQVGLMAAFLLALNPWNIQQSRWGHEVSLAALLGLVPLAAMLKAGLPVGDNKGAKISIVWAFMAGLVTGICCYGYHAVRIFVPIFLMTVVLFNLPQWWKFIKTRRGFSALAVFVFGVAITFGPLAWQHIFHPEGISRHGRGNTEAGNFLFSAPLGTAVRNVFDRYIHHFGPDFLFIHGDPSVIQAPPGCGQYHGYMLPLMIFGFIYVLYYFKMSPSVRTILAFVLAYPVGDCLYFTPGMHALRSAPGMCSLILLAAAGAVFGTKWLWNQNRRSAITTIVIFAVVMISLNVRFFNNFYVKFNHNQDIYRIYHTDFVEACRWLKPHIKNYDGIFFTVNSLNMPYVVSLVMFDYDPEQWFKDKRAFFTNGEWDYYTRYGKMYFMYNDSFVPALKDLTQKNPPGRVLFVVRPGEFNLTNPIHRIIGPDGTDALWLCEPSFVK